MKFDPDELFEKAIDAGYDMADTRHAFRVLEETLDSLKSSIIYEYIQDGKSATEANATCKKDTRWVDAAQQVADAERQWLKAKVKYEQIKAYIDNVRTEAVTHRQLTT